MADDADSDLQWNAFLYVSGELDAEATLAFESLLLSDQSAREAVASAVELIQAVVLVQNDSETVLAMPRHSRRRRRFALASMAAAAVVACALIPSFRPASKPEPDASSVALRWSGLRQGIDAEWNAVVTGSSSVQVEDPALPNDNESLVEDSGERPLPSWLLSAASAPRGDSPQEEN